MRKIPEMSEFISDFLKKLGDKRRYEVKNEKDNEATIYLYDVIGQDYFEGVSAQKFVNDLNEIKAETIHLRINSPGGDVFDARAMQTALLQKKARIIAHIDGLAASAATYVMLGADEIEAVDGAIFMIHNAWGITVGNKNDMTKMAETLDKIDQGITKDYVQKTGQKLEKIQNWMDAETDFTAKEALKYGFIDRIFKLETKNTADLTVRDIEHTLRDAGLTVSQTKKLLANGVKGVLLRDEEEQPKPIERNKNIASAIRKNIETFTVGV